MNITGRTATFENVDRKIIDDLLKYGFQKEATKSPYEIFRLTGPCYVIYFSSKKLLLQGKPECVTNISKLISSMGYKVIKTSATGDRNAEQYTAKFHAQDDECIEIGSDEVLKGDTFGGIVVAAVLANGKERAELRRIGVTDSKELTGMMINDIAQKIRAILPSDQISVRNMYPADYNESLKTGSVTALLNRLHEYVHKDLDSKNRFKIDGKKLTHITDKYPGCTVGDIIEEKAESKYVSVAAASIIARNAGLIQLETLANRLNFRVPKGSTHVRDALEFLRESGKDPKEFVKVDFKNVKESLCR